MVACRSPHGERGLKLLSKKQVDVSERASLPAWGAWIEIHNLRAGDGAALCRSPHGERGLKLVAGRLRQPGRWSLPAWGAWIEILAAVGSLCGLVVAPRMGSVD